MNEVTWKLTNGEITNAPASHGQWAGYRTTKAIAWVICLVPRRWLARHGDKTCGPMSLPKAKTAAVAMAKGAVGDYYLPKPIPHLNGLAARLIDLDAGVSDLGDGNE